MNSRTTKTQLAPASASSARRISFARHSRSVVRFALAIAVILGVIFGPLGCAGTHDSTSSAPPPSQPAPVISVAVQPATVNVPAGGAQVFTANVSGATGASADVTWSVNGIAGGNATVGVVAANGSSNGSPTAVYTAPGIPPSPAAVTIAATSVTDPTKSAAATATITCPSSSSLSPASASVSLSQTQSFSATLCLEPSATISWDVNGVAGGNAALGAIASTGPATAQYSAPADLPSPPSVTIHAVPSAVATGSASASASVAITSSVAVSIAPPSATASLGQRISFSASVANTSDAAVTWSVNGVVGGNSALGRVCVSGSNPCTPPAGPVSGAVDFLAPLSDDDRTGIRSLYPDPADAVNIGAIRGRVVPANPFSLAMLPAPSAGSSVTGIFGAHVVAVDADTGSVVAGVLGGWSCSAGTPPSRFDGSFDIERLPVGRNYMIYAEPLVDLAAPSDFAPDLGSCPSGSAPACAAPAVNMDFNPAPLPLSH